jgi:hypothetical protein
VAELGFGVVGGPTITGHRGGPAGGAGGDGLPGRRRGGGGRRGVGEAETGRRKNVGGGGRAIGGSFKITAVNSLESSETAGEGKKATHWTSKIFTGTYTRYSNQNIHSSNIIFTRCFSFTCCFNVPAI